MPLPHDPKTLLARRLFRGGGLPALENHILEIDAGRIAAIRPAQPADRRTGALETVDIIAPGFVDLQINGAGDRQFNDDPTVETLRVMAEAARKGGTAHILPTFITAVGQDYRHAIAAVQAAMAQGVPGILGLHLEGPFLSPHRPGIHPPDAIRPIRTDDVDLITQAAQTMPVLLTLAPEMVPDATLARLVAAGVTVFAGHSEATADQIASAEALGLRGATHLFNAMGQMTARAPGVVGAVMASDRLFAGVIADGHHVDWRSLKVACRAMPGRLFLVTDAMLTLAGRRDSFAIGARQIALRDGRLQDAQGTLAGAHLDMVGALRNLVAQCAIPLAQAIEMASGIPARAIGCHPKLGQITPGGPVSLTLLSDDLVAQATLVENAPTR